MKNLFVYIYIKKSGTNQKVLNQILKISDVAFELFNQIIQINWELMKVLDFGAVFENLVYFVSWEVTPTLSERTLLIIFKIVIYVL